MHLELEELVNPVIDLALEVGEFIQGESMNLEDSDVELKGFNDLVSYVDREAEKKIVKRLQQVLPEAGFITEEDTIKTQQKEFNWVIDPLDGTTNFIHRLPVYAVSIALEKDNLPLLGIVLDVYHQDCFHALKQGGAFLNGNPIRVSDAQDLDGSLIATGFPYLEFEHLDVYFDILHTFMEKCHGIRRMGSAAIDLAYVACGRFEGFFEYNLNSWDVAGGALLITEAGGKVTDFQGGDDYLFGREILAGCHIQPKMLEIVKSKWKTA